MLRRSWAVMCLCLGMSLAGVGCGGSSLNGTIVDGTGNGTENIDAGDKTSSASTDITPPPPTPEVCNDGADNDANGVTDCADLACASDAACAPAPTAEVCNDGVDNDGNGVKDCSDLACDSDVACAPAPTPEVCDNASDDDGDGLANCDDPECSGDAACGGGGGDGEVVDFGKIDLHRYEVAKWRSFGPDPVCFNCPDPTFGWKDYVFDPADSAELVKDFGIRYTAPAPSLEKREATQKDIEVNQKESVVLGI